MEDVFGYVVRKLNEPTINIEALSRETGLSRFMLDKIAKGGDVKYSVIQNLYGYFRNLSL